MAALVPLVVFLVALRFDSLWDWMGFGHLDPLFADLVAILAAGQADQAGLDAYAIPNPLDPFGRPHVYGPWWLVTGMLGLQVEDAWWVGGILLLVFLIAGALVLNPSRFGTAVWSVLFLASPPIMLGLERGNNDLIVFLLLALAAWLLSRKGAAGAAAATGVVVLAAGLKLYPVAAVPMLAARVDRWRSVLTVGLVVAVWWFFFGATSSEGIRRSITAAPAPETIFAYGIDVTRYTWRVLAGSREWLASGVVLALTSVAILLRGEWRKLWHAVPVDASRGIFFAAGVFPWLFCYVATTNFPYRIALLLLPAQLWLAQWSDANFGRLARVQLVMWLLVAWLSAPKHWAIARLLDDPDAMLPSVASIVAVEQGLIAILAVPLVLSSLGWLVRQLQSYGRELPSQESAARG